jgi:hypothetical protein
MVPIPKDQQKKYGLIAAHLQNLGFSYETAKNKADRAIKDTKGTKRQKSSMKG